MAEYVKNAELRDLILEYNKTNIEDDGSWLNAYKKRMTKKFETGKLKKEKYDLAINFVNTRIANNAAKQSADEGGEVETADEDFAF